MVIYTVLVRTADVPGAGTDASVYVRLLGERGRCSDEYRLRNPDHDDFVQGSLDVFSLSDLPPDLGRVAAITIRHDGGGHADAWSLVEVSVRQTTPEIGPFVIFPVNAVLDGVEWVVRPDGSRKPAAPGEDPAVDAEAA